MDEKAQHHRTIFLKKLDTLIDANLGNEQFGVSRLADEMGMSRSNLHRKLRRETGKSISQYIREYRLRKAHELLRNGNKNANEVAHAVGFGSASYFSKCFSEHFGYSPTKIPEQQESVNNSVKTKKSRKKSMMFWAGGLGVILLGAFLIFYSGKEDSITDDKPWDKKSIIVLPFKNLSSDQENQYLADGMVEAISRHLSSIDGFEVFNSSSAGPTTSIKEIGRLLNVSNVLLGSVQKDQDMIRVEVQLVDTKNEKHIWAESYDKELYDILGVQSDIARRVASKLRTSLSASEITIINRRTAYNPEAYDYFLKGSYLSAIYTHEAQKTARKNLFMALEIDSTIAPAHLRLASCYHVSASVMVAEISSSEGIEKAKKHIDKALEIDPDLAEAKAWRAYQNLFGKWDFEATDIGKEMVIKLDLPDGYNIYLDFLNFEHRHEEALQLCKELEKRQPFYPYNRFLLTYYYLGKWDEGKRHMQTKLRVQPADPFVLDNVGFFMLNTGEYDDAISTFYKVIEMTDKRLPRMLGWMGAAYAHKGETKTARKLLNELAERKKQTDAGAPAFFAGILTTALGEHETALDWLELAVQDHEHEVPWLVSEPQLYPLHGHPRFDALVQKVGFRPHAYPVEDSIVKRRIAVVSPYVSEDLKAPLPIQGGVASRINSR